MSKNKFRIGDDVAFKNYIGRIPNGTVFKIVYREPDYLYHIMLIGSVDITNPVNESELIKAVEKGNGRIFMSWIINTFKRMGNWLLR